MSLILLYRRFYFYMNLIINEISFFKHLKLAMFIIYYIIFLAMC